MKVIVPCVGLSYLFSKMKCSFFPSFFDIFDLDVFFACISSFYVFV